MVYTVFMFCKCLKPGNDELTQKEVAEKLGISQSYISRIEKKVIKRLRTVVSNF